MSENMSDPELKKFLWLDDKELNDFKEDRQTFIEGSDHYALPDMVGSALNVTATSPDYYSGVYLHVGMPDIHMDFETGAIAVSGSEKVLENGKKLLAALKKAQLAESLGIVSDSWYNG